MKQGLYAALARMDPRVLLIAMTAILGLVAFEGWYLVLRKPLLEYQKVVATRNTLASVLTGAASVQDELPRLAGELMRLADRLAGQLRLPASDDQMVASLMTELDHSARGHGITLSGIRPGARRQVLSFEEASFDISAQGKYLALCHWLLGFEKALGQSATISDFTMKSTDEGRQVALTVRVALYRALPAPGAGT